MKSNSPNNSFEMLIIRNDGPAIAYTNYWSEAFDQSGKFIVSYNIDYRILLPDSLENMLQEMETAKEVIVSRGPWAQAGTHGFEILFDDHSDSPFQMTTSQSACAGFMPEPGACFDVTVWTRGHDNQAIKRLTLPGRYRHARSLPCLAPWSPADSKPLFA